MPRRPLAIGLFRDNSAGKLGVTGGADGQFHRDGLVGTITAYGQDLAQRSFWALRRQDAFLGEQMGKYQRGEYGKVEVGDESTGDNEWMWVLVDYSDGAQRLVFGKFDNRHMDSRRSRQMILRTIGNLCVGLAVLLYAVPLPILIAEPEAMTAGKARRGA